MTVREDKIGQSWLFPPCIADFIPEDHICNLVVAVVSCIDVSEIEEKYLDQPGNPAYPRRMLLRLLVQAAIDGVWSSRKIDKLAHENVVYMYLAGNEKPDEDLTVKIATIDELKKSGFKDWFEVRNT
jgi:transposase